MLLSRATSVGRLGLVCALLLSGCTLLPSVLEPTFQADTLVGRDAWFFSDLTLRPSVQQALRARDLMDLFTGPAADAGVDLHQLPTPSGRVVDFERDVVPHLDGEIALALSGAVDDPHYLMLAHTNDVEGMLRLVSEDAQPRVSKDARGVVRVSGTSTAGADASGYKNWIVVTNTEALRDQTLDQIDGKKNLPTLASDGRYTSVVSRLVGDRLGFGYFDVAPLIDRASREDAQVTEALKARGRLAFSFGVEDGPQPNVHVLGLRFEYIPDLPFTAPVPKQGDTLQAMDRLPKAAVFAAGGPDLSTYAKSLAMLSEDDVLANEVQALVDQFVGPFAFGVTAPTISLSALDTERFSNVVGGVFFIAKLAPDADADEITDAINAVADEAVVGWPHQVVVADDWLALNAVPPGVSLDDLPEDLLASDTQYQWVRRGFSQTGSSVYINLKAIENAVLGDLASGEALAAVKPFRAIGLSAQTEPGGDGHAHMTVLIGTD